MDLRINKYLSEAGVCSRRRADELVLEGRVLIDGVAAFAGCRVTDGQTVTLDGKIIEIRKTDVLLAFNKPRGVICSASDSHNKNNIVDYIGYDKRIYPVGRLDKDSQGLILMTNMGDVAKKVTDASNYHEKEYVVTVNKAVTKDFVDAMSNGLYIKELDKTTAPCRVEQTGLKTFTIILVQGLNRQIRRMCECLGYKVITLKRVRIMNIELGNLKEGTYREISGSELKTLTDMLDKKK